MQQTVTLAQSNIRSIATAWNKHDYDAKAWMKILNTIENANTILIHGPAGTGKKHLAGLIGTYFQKRVITCGIFFDIDNRFITASEVNATARATSNRVADVRLVATTCKSYDEWHLPRGVDCLIELLVPCTLITPLK
jgi:hypothetical protein